MAMYLKMMRIRVGMFRNVAAVVRVGCCLSVVCLTRFPLVQVCVPSLCGPTDDCYRGGE